MILRYCLLNDIINYRYVPFLQTSLSNIKTHFLYKYIQKHSPWMFQTVPQSWKVLILINIIPFRLTATQTKSTRFLYYYYFFASEFLNQSDENYKTELKFKGRQLLLHTDKKECPYLLFICDFIYNLNNRVVKKYP